MDVRKRILCLANSRKRNGRCIAGLELEGGCRQHWIRPVSDRPNQEVSEYERMYIDGSDPCVLDLVDTPLLCPIPVLHQQENWLLDPGRTWEKAGRFPWSGLGSLVDSESPLWLFAESNFSTYNGHNDYIPAELTNRVCDSLRLIHLENMEIKVFRPGAAFDNPQRRVQGRFEYAGKPYWLWVTDPVYERKFLALPDGNHTIEECYATISLGEVYDGKCYKLIAAIMESEGRVCP